MPCKGCGGGENVGDEQERFATIYANQDASTKERLIQRKVQICWKCEHFAGPWRCPKVSNLQKVIRDPNATCPEGHF